MARKREWRVDTCAVEEAQAVLNEMEQAGHEVEQLNYDQTLGRFVIVSHNRVGACQLEGCGKRVQGAKAYCCLAHKQKAYRQRVGAPVLKAREKNKERFDKPKDGRFT